MKRHNLLLLLTITTILFASCRTSQNVRLHSGMGDQMVGETTIEKLQDSAEQLRIQKVSIERHPEFSLGTIEFNDEGLSFSREQRAAVSRMVRDEAHERGAIIVTFVHGWKHNATVCDANLSCFRSVLRFLGRREGPAGRRVIGVYIGWRGLEYCNATAKQFSFWTRKRIGERLGTNQARRAINDLMVIYNDIRREHDESRFVAVGHSLGAGVLFSAVGPMYRQALHDAIEERHGDTLELIEGYKDTAGRDLKFPDLVVLANPAFEAELYKRTPADLAEMKASSVRFSPRQLPLLLSISSEGDAATHIIFPVGQTIKVVFSPIMWLRGITYLARNIRTAANYRPFTTDLATAVEVPPTTPLPRMSRPENCFAGNLASVTGGNCGCNELAPLARAMEDGASSGFGVQTRRYGNVRLQRLPSIDPHNPFIVATAQRAVLSNHNDIFNPTFMSLLIDLVGEVDKAKQQPR